MTDADEKAAWEQMLDEIRAEAYAQVGGRAVMVEPDPAAFMLPEKLGEGNFQNAYGRWFHPIGPAPEGWRQIKGCSCTIPHTGEAEAWMNDEMNADHYRDATEA